MKKYFLSVVVTCFISSLLFAQSDTHQHYYGEIQGIAKIFNSTLKLSFHYGQNAAIFELARSLEYNRNMQTFTNMMDAMNFLSAHGWELVDTYTSSDNANENLMYHWVVRIDSAKLTQEKKE